MSQVTLADLNFALASGTCFLLGCSVLLVSVIAPLAAVLWQVLRSRSPWRRRLGPWLTFGLVSASRLIVPWVFVIVWAAIQAAIEPAQAPGSPPTRPVLLVVGVLVVPVLVYVVLDAVSWLSLARAARLEAPPSDST